MSTKIMKKYSPTFYIYGIYDKQGVCLYVGQTMDKTNRRDIHTRYEGARFYKQKFRVIRSCRMEDVLRLEIQIGSAYQRKGQATFSRFFGNGPALRREYSGYFVSGYAEPFHSQKDAAAAAGCSTQTLNKHLESGALIVHEVWPYMERIVVSESPIELTYEI